MSKNRVLFVAAVLAALVLLVVSCAPAAPAAPTAAPAAPTAAPAAPTAVPPTETPPMDKAKVALLTYGLVTGDPWNALGYAGLQQAEKDLGVQIALTDNLTPPNFEGAMRDYASQGYNLIIGHSFGFGDPAKAMTKDFPNTFFTVNTGAVNDERVASFNLQDQQNGYLTGALAAMVNKTGTIGILGGLDYPSVIKEINGYIDGAKAINPNIKVLVGYVGSWDDPAKAQELAKSMIEQGADVLSHKAGGSGVGVVKAAEAAGVWAINDVATCMETAPKACLTSTDLKFDNVVYNTVKAYLDKKLEGKIYNWGIAENAVDIGPINSAVPKETVDKITALRQQILDGKLVVEEKWSPTW
jgi:basic membrane protein A and related proteins